MPIYCDADTELGFVYVWFNKLSNRYYIGSHCGHPNDGYTGSGTHFKRAYEKYGPDVWVRHIEYYGPDYRQEETDLIKFFDACNCPESYNIMHIDQTGCSISLETRAKISAAARNMSEETRTKMSAAHKGKTFTEEHRANMSAARKGRVFSDEARAKMSAAHKGKTFTEEHRANMSAARKGKKHSEETRAKLSVPRSKVTCPNCGKAGGSNTMKRWHFDNCKMGA